MNRREFSQYLALGWAMGVFPSFQVSAQRPPASPLKVLVVGAGIAGLAAANTLAAQGVEVTILEARSRIGGRIWTDRSAGFPIELGAGWIHGHSKANPITALAKAIDAPWVVSQEDSYAVFDEQGKRVDDNTLNQYYRQYKNLIRQQYSVAQEGSSLLQTLLKIQPDILQDPLMVYQLALNVEFDYAGAIEELSAEFWEDDKKFPGNDVLLPQGYDAIVNYLAQNLSILNNHQVNTITQTNENIVVSTNQGDFSADYAIVTVPLGVLKQGHITFLPPLSTTKTEAFQHVEMGTVNRVVLQFEQAFWDSEVQYLGYASHNKGLFPCFFNMEPYLDQNILTGFAVGNFGKEMESFTDAQITEQAMAILRKMYGNQIPLPQSQLITKWGADPFAYGSYSFAKAGFVPQDREILGRPEGQRLLFAGEHTHVEYPATVHGAFLSGIREANRILGR